MNRFAKTYIAMLTALLAVCSFASSGEPVSSAKSTNVLPKPDSISVEPIAFSLNGSDTNQRLIVSGSVRNGTESKLLDFSRGVTYRSSDPKIATVTADGVVVPHQNGKVEIHITAGGQTATSRATVVGQGVEEKVSFRNQIVPIFTKRGCNAGGCHGKASGQNGFRLSLLGFDPEFDFTAVTREARGRRIFPASPDNSMILLKAIGAVPHGGGRRIQVGSREYELLRRWIHQGTPAGSVADPAVTKIQVFPSDRVVPRHGEQQLLVTATYSDGTIRDVTNEAQFKSNEQDLATVDDGGLLRTLENTGDTAIMARYMGYVDVCRVSIPMTDAPVASAKDWPAKKNYIDEMVQNKWQQLKLVPSPLADDATFLRRAFLDAIGTLPTPEEVREFLADTDKNKREKWVDRILARNEYADYWAVKWGDLLRNQRKSQKEHIRGTYAFHAWIRNAFATNMPYDQFVRNIIAAQGTVDQHPPVIWYRSVRNPTHQTNDTAQLFLGTRINCAQCHHHPYEKWSQDDYYRLQAFFARMGRKNGEIAQEPAIFVKPDGEVRNPATGKIVKARGLDGPEIVIEEEEDPRGKLVDWMASADNPFFAKAICNRIWAHLEGRGLVEPIDDMRVTNPPTNPQLMDALAKDFIAHKFDLKYLMRTIMISSTYQLSSDPIPGNIHDKQNYARAYPRRLTAEVMLDGIDQITGTPENFGGMPKNTRAIQLPDESIGSYFLDVFGRPTRETACECERPREANLAQSLHLLNSSDMQGKLAAPTGRLTALLKTKKTDPEMIEELYLLALSRPPRPDEKTKVAEYIAAEKDRKAAFEDLLWALLNTKEFLFNH